MRVAVYGGGGREHATAWTLAKSDKVERVFCLPGNAGTLSTNKCQNIEGLDAIDDVAKWAAEEQLDLMVVGPEAPLVGQDGVGIVDIWPKGLRIWGPNAKCAQFEGSKIFAKTEMNRFGIPTAEWWQFDSPEAALDWLKDQKDRPLVVKADGLTGGKGAIVCKNKAEVIEAIGLMASFGPAGLRFIIEECLVGREASLFLLCGTDGTILPLETAQDYKRAFDHDEGPNTGGMGCYSPASHLSSRLIGEIVEKHRPMIAEWGYDGYLYIGLMLTKDGWFVLEYNVRMGDPETQVVFPRLETDLFELLYALAGGEQYPAISWTDQACVTVVMTNNPYPDSYPKGDVIYSLDEVGIKVPEAIVFHAGTQLVNGETQAVGGRVLGVTGLGDDVAKARVTAYRAVDLINWEHERHRNDIALGV